MRIFSILFRALLLSLAVFFFLSASSIYAADYYVSTTGSDSNSGSESSPWKTIQKGINSLKAGDILYIKGGTYPEKLNVNTSGTSSAPITISGYADEMPTVDGSNISLGCYDFLVTVKGSYVNLEKLKVANSTGGGMYIGGTASSIKNVSLSHLGETGAVLAGTNNIADTVTVTDNGYRYGSGCSTWGSALCTVGKDSVIKNSLTYNNVGEGLNAYAASSGAIIEDNVSYDNKSVNLYVDSSSGTIVRRNLVYHSPNSSSSSRGITIGGETGGVSNVTIVNNFVMGGFVNLEVDSNVTSLNGVNISYNTFVNSRGDANSGYNMGIYFRSNLKSFSNSTFSNNLVIEEPSNRTPVSVSSSHNGLTFSHNAWSKTPNSAAQGAGDITCPTSDCGISKNGTYSAGALSPEWFKILSNSPARDKAEVISSVSEDFFKNQRGSLPDIGAHEFDASSSPSSPVPTAGTSTPSPTPKPGDANWDKNVNETDFGIWFSNYKQSVKGGNTVGDFNNSGKVDGVDYVIWLNNYGK